MSSLNPIPRSARRQDLVAYAGQTVFGPANFKVFDTADVRVRVRAAGASRFVTARAGYSVAANPPFGTPTVTFATGRVAGDVVRIEGARTPSRTTDVTFGGAIRSGPLEAELDKATVSVQEAARDVADLVDTALTRGTDDSFPAGRLRIAEVADPRDRADAATRGFTEDYVGRRISASLTGTALNSLFLQPLPGAVERRALDKLGEPVSVADFGAVETSSAFRAALTAGAAAAAARAAGLGLSLAAGLYSHSAYAADGSLSRRLGAAGSVMLLQPGAVITAPEGAGALDLAPGAGMVGFNEGANRDVWYWGRRLTGSCVSGVGAIDAGFSGNAFMFDIRGDDRDMGPDGEFMTGFALRHIVDGGASVRGGRQGFYASLHREGPTSIDNPNRNYAAAQFSAYANAGDRGFPGTWRGADFGIGAAYYATRKAVYMLNGSGGEVNTFTEAFDPAGPGPTIRFLTGFQIVQCNATRGVDLDAALSFSGQGQNGIYGPHIGADFVMVLTDKSGAIPFHPGSTLIGTKFFNRAGLPAPGLQTGIDLSGVNVTGNLIQGQHSALSEFSLTLGNKQVVGARQASIADAVDAASTTSRINAVLAALRTHGLIES